MILSTIISVILLFSTPLDVVPGTVINEQSKKHCIEYLEKHLNVSNAEKDAAGYLKTMKDDGSWDDIDYKSKVRGGWPTSHHISRLRSMACAYHATGKVEYLEGARKALKYWADTMPVCPNWWHNEIGVPKVLGPALILIRESLTPEEIGYGVKIMSKASFKQTGQNKIWQAGNVLMKAILLEDENLIMAARDTILSEIRISGNEEGLQPDWSFHQHGPQLQFGNYGGAYACDLSDWVNAFDGTALQVSEEQREILSNYIRNGLEWLVWNGWFDMSACARQIFKGTQRSKANGVMRAMRNMGMQPEEKRGGMYYPYSDFGVYRTSDWYSSVRMQSRRVKGFENTNKENMKAYFSADGAVLVRRNGDEYNDIAPVWNWRHIPGVTCYDDGTELYGCKAKMPYNDTDLVFGKVEGDFMVAAFELKRDGLSARKAYFFSPNGIVYLGAGIKRDAEQDVTTGVEQCLIKDEIENNGKWIRHNGITYVPLGCKFSMAPLEHSGSWRPILPTYSDKIIKKDLLDIYIDHGAAPKDASYSYVVIPNGMEGNQALKYVRKNVKVISNTTGIQSVSIEGKILSIDWAKAEITIK